MKKPAAAVCIALVLTIISTAGLAARDLTLHEAEYLIRLDVGFGRMVEADSYVLVYRFEHSDDVAGFTRWIEDINFLDFQWRSAVEGELEGELVGFTDAVSDNRHPSWERTISLDAADNLVLLFVDEDIAFDEPFGYVVLEARGYRDTELWIEGAGGRSGTRVGTVVVSMR